MRKFLYMAVTALLILVNTTVVKASDEIYLINRENIEITEDEYNNLLELGFTDAQIYNMDYQTYIDNKDIEAELISTEGKYIKTTTTIRNGIKTYTSYEMTESEIMADMLMHNLGPTYNLNTSGNYYDGISMDTYRYMETKISNVYDIQMRYKVDVVWLQIPSVRSYDIIGIGIEPSKVEISSSIMFHQSWVTTDNEVGNSEAFAPKEETTGGSGMFKLPNGSLSSLDSYLYFYVIKKDNVGTLTSIVAVGDYAHATETVDLDGAYDAYTVNHGGGIEIDSPYHNSYESSLSADAIFAGTW